MHVYVYLIFFLLLCSFALHLVFIDFLLCCSALLQSLGCFILLLVSFCAAFTWLYSVTSKAFVTIFASVFAVSCCSYCCCCCFCCVRVFPPLTIVCAHSIPLSLDPTRSSFVPFTFYSFSLLLLFTFYPSHVSSCNHCPFAVPFALWRHSAWTHKIYKLKVALFSFFLFCPSDLLNVQPTLTGILAANQLCGFI